MREDESAGFEVQAVAPGRVVGRAEGCDGGVGMGIGDGG